MTSNNNAEFVVPTRQPAARVAGQRRRLSRPPPRASRSNTLPVLNRETSSGSSDGAASTSGGNGAACGGSGSGIHSILTPQTGAGAGIHSTSTSKAGTTGTHVAASQSMINLRPPMGVPTLGPIIHDHRDTASTSPAPASESIVTVASSSKHLAVAFPIAEPSTAKKKSTLALLNPFSSKTPADPFPPDTPTKAARLLGEFSDSDDDENAPPKKSWKRKAKQMSDALLFRSPPPTLSRSQADLTDYRAPDADLETDFVYSIGSSTPATDRKGKGKGKGKAKAPTIMSKIEEDSSDDEESALVNEPASFPPRGDSLGVSVRSPLQAVEDELLDEMEEVKIGVVEVVMARRVRPEEVKLVNIPARKKKSREWRRHGG